MTSTEESSHSNTISSLENEEEVDEDENSKVNCEKGDIFREFSNNFLNNPKASFPVKLHKILSNPEYSGIISWLPNGESWRVLQPKVFAEKIIPLYFRHARFPSFMRQVNGWGFRRISEGVDENSYSNELFLRDSPRLCLKMRRLNQQTKSSSSVRRTKRSSSSEQSSLSSKNEETPSSFVTSSAPLRNTASEGQTMPKVAILNSPNRNPGSHLRLLHESPQDQTSIQHQMHMMETCGLTGVRSPNIPQTVFSSSLPQVANYNANSLPFTNAADLYNLQQLQLQQYLVNERIKQRLHLVAAENIASQSPLQNQLLFDNLFSSL